MALRVYRVCRSAYARLDGEGARRVGGRWNSPGHAVVYMAESVALAVLENLVHLPKRDFPEKYVAVTALLAESVRVLGVDEFQRAGEPESDTGDRWIDSGDSAVLRVKSVVVPGENLYLLNPVHPDFEQIRVEGIEPFAFDERLF